MTLTELVVAAVAAGAAASPAPTGAPFPGDTILVQHRGEIGAGLAVDICDRFVRRRLERPVRRLATQRTSGGYRKTVNLSYVLEPPPGSRYMARDALCVLEGRRIVDFTIR